MKKYGLIASIILLILVNAFVLSGVYYNRSGNTEAYIELTERELALESFDFFSYALDKENSGISLHLKMGNDSYDFSSHKYDWFDQKKLEEIGFNCSKPLSDPKAKFYYHKMLSRKTYVVLEYEGKTWEEKKSAAETKLKKAAQEAQQGKEAKKEYEETKDRIARYLKTGSRLFAVDASNDPVSLRKKYPDVSQYIITPAEVTIHFQEGSEPSECNNNKKTPPSLSGDVQEVLVREIHVPPEKRQIPENLLKKEKKGDLEGVRFTGLPFYKNGKIRDPYYKIILKYGNRYEPWVVDVKRIL